MFESGRRIGKRNGAGPTMRREAGAWPPIASYQFQNVARGFPAGALRAKQILLIQYVMPAARNRGKFPASTLAVMAGHSPSDRRASFRTPYVPAIHAVMPQMALQFSGRFVNRLKRQAF